MNAAFDWKEFPRLILPVFIFFFMVLRPLFLRWNRNKKAEIPKSGSKPALNSENTPQPGLLIEEPTLFPEVSGSNSVTRLVEDLDENANTAVRYAAEANSVLSADRIRRLGDLQQRILWAYILGPPGGLASRENQGEY